MLIFTLQMNSMYNKHLKPGDVKFTVEFNLKKDINSVR